MSAVAGRLVGFQQKLADQYGQVSVKLRRADTSLRLQPLQRPSEANTLAQITHLCLRFHSRKSFSSCRIFQRIQYMSPWASTGTQECAKSSRGKAKSSPCATPLPHVCLCQLMVRALLLQVKGCEHDVHSLLQKIFCCNNTGKTQTNTPPPGHAPACMIHTFNLT